MAARRATIFLLPSPPPRPRRARSFDEVLEVRPVRPHDHVAGAAEDALQRRQAPPARALAAHLRVIANLVADHRRGEILEIGAEQPADLAFAAGPPRIVHHLDEQRLRHQMIEPAGRAFDRQIAKLLRRIAIAHLDLELPRGHAIFAAGAPAANAFLVVRGAAEIISIAGEPTAPPPRAAPAGCPGS